MHLRFHDCPKCGRPESCWSSEDFCGKCEREYQEEKQADLEAAIKEIKKELANHNPECDCTRCTQLYARQLAMNGREGDAIAFLNQ
jgi:hypothetical protein